MSRHTALLPIPDLCRAAGLEVVELDGWDTAQGTYYWTHPDTGAQSYDQLPSCFMVHHTAGAAATPVVRDSRGNWSKANAWLGLWDGNDRYRITQDGPGIPLLVFTSAGPARVSSGYGYRPAAWDYTFKDLRAPWKAEGSDGGTALNRYAVNLETVHRGDGSPLDLGVWDTIVTLGVVLQRQFGWDERTLGHLSWTRRKIDSRWSVGAPNDGERCIIDIQDAIARRMQEGEMAPIGPGDTGVNVEKLQDYLNRWVTDPRYTGGREYLYAPIEETGTYDAATQDRVVRFQSWSAIEAHGLWDYFTAATMSIVIGPDTGTAPGDQSHHDEPSGDDVEDAG